MATNEVFNTSRILSVVCSHPATPASGDPVRFGARGGVALIDEGESISGETTVDFGGVYDLSVKGIDDNGNSAVALGDSLFYVDGDTPHLSKKSSGYFFGLAMETVVSGATTTIRVMIIDAAQATVGASAVGSAQMTSDMMRIANVVLTSAQVKALKATPITLVAAPGADLAVVPIAVNLVVNYGGSNAFTESADDLSIGYAAGAEIKEIESTGLIDQTNDEWRYITFEHAETFIPEENVAVVITNLDDEIAGNAGANNTISVRLIYRLVPTDA